ncbi:hypothetical protein [Mucilaginibacter sp. UYCu711]|uniref:hypothetical protein n=1 Tax=Mucilaginibacter sp. UYCu711 TaxID=3156339 RepID=UPI003D1E95BF
MVTKEDLQRKYATLSTSELMNILDNKFSYTDLAVTVAIEELAKRSPSEEDVKNYKEEILDEVNTFIVNNIEVDLTTWQKMLFYLFWFPILTFAFKRNYREDGYILKVRQANYYSFVGFIALIISAFLSLPLNLSSFGEIALWMTGFFPAYLFDEYFNRLQQIKKLKKIFKVDDTDQTDDMERQE